MPQAHCNASGWGLEPKNCSRAAWSGSGLLCLACRANIQTARFCSRCAAGLSAGGNPLARDERRRNFGQNAANEKGPDPSASWAQSRCRREPMESRRHLAAQATTHREKALAPPSDSARKSMNWAKRTRALKFLACALFCATKRQKIPAGSVSGGNGLFFGGCSKPQCRAISAITAGCAPVRTAISIAAGSERLRAPPEKAMGHHILSVFTQPAPAPTRNKGEIQPGKGRPSPPVRSEKGVPR